MDFNLSDYQHYNSFDLTDPKTGKKKNLTEDFGGIIINTNDEVYERECMPQLNFITDKNDNRDGEIFVNANYGVRNIDMTVLFTEELGGGDLFELKKWLGKKYQQIFSWEGDDEEKSILAIETGGWKSQVYYTKHFFGKLDFKFICHNPYYFKTKDRDVVFTSTNLVIGQVNNVRSKGNSDSYPLIKITPNGTQAVIKLQWNDLVATLSNVDKEIYLDCEICKCYEIINGIKIPTSLKYSSNQYIDYPEINCEEKNSITLLEGSVSEIKITPNTRII